MTDIRPQDLPELRAEIAEWLKGQDATRTWKRRVEGGVYEWILNAARSKADPAGAADYMRTRERDRLVGATLFYVGAEMIELAQAAARTIPNFDLEVEDLPAPAGLMVFEKSIAVLPTSQTKLGTDTPIRAVSWDFRPHPNTASAAPVVFGSGYSERSEMQPAYDRIGWTNRFAGHPRLFQEVGTEFVWQCRSGQGIPTVDRPMIAELGPILRSAWLLMSQPLACDAEVEADRAAKKRVRRAGYEPSPVRVIELRRPKSSGDGDGESNYQHRWIVRGHWRNHWHPKREVHRPVWIAPHVKGPEGAPMIGGEKVYAWKR